MQKTIRVLAVLLALQVALAVGLSFTGPDLAATASDAPLVAFEAEQVDSVIIEAPGEPKVVLTKVKGTWQLPEKGGFPVEGEKVSRMLRRLAALKRGQPMATTAGAQRRFQVSEDKFERRVVLAAGGKALRILYLGASAKADQIYARADDEKGIFGVGLATYEVPAKVTEWEDKAILQIPGNEIEAIDVAGLRLERVADSAAARAAADTADAAAAEPTRQWRATAGLPGTQQLNAQAADNLARRVAELQIGEVLGRTQEPRYGLEKPVLSLSVTRKGGKQIDYRLGKSPATEEYTLHVSTRPEYFRLYSYGARPLIDAAARDSLLAGR